MSMMHLYARGAQRLGCHFLQSGATQRGKLMAQKQRCALL